MTSNARRKENADADRISQAPIAIILRSNDTDAKDEEAVLHRTRS